METVSTLTWVDLGSRYEAIAKQQHSAFPWAKFGKKQARGLTIVSMILNMLNL